METISNKDCMHILQIYYIRMYAMYISISFKNLLLYGNLTSVELKTGWEMDRLGMTVRKRAFTGKFFTILTI